MRPVLSHISYLPAAVALAYKSIPWQQEPAPRRHSASASRIFVPVEPYLGWLPMETVLLPSAITATPGMIREAVGTLGPLPALTLDVGTED